MANALFAAVRALETRLAAAFPLTPIAWPNVPFAAPPDMLWMRPWTLFGAGQLLTMRPEGRNQVLGIYQVSIYSPLERGTNEALTVGEQVRALYNRAQFGGVRCNAPSGPVTLPEEPPWYGVAVSVPFTVEETAFVP